MKRDSLDSYDTIPSDMRNYIRNYGRHFNSKLLKFAVSRMRKKDDSDKLNPIAPVSKERVDQLLSQYGVTIENNELYDYVYVANMCKADFYKSSVPDEQHMAMYIKDVIDDDDSYDGIVFNRWYADMCRKGIPIDWESML